MRDECSVFCTSMNEKKKNMTVAVGMSGGVDSSVAAALLVQEGYTVIGITMKTYDYMEVGGAVPNESSCCDLHAVMDARAVADKLGIAHYVTNVRDEFNRVVIENFSQEYLEGRTPNPCVRCNRDIKWGVLFERAKEFGAEYIATGHYARVRFDEARQRSILSTGKFTEKDQSYALWGIRQAALRKTLFPLGNMTKPEVRSLAEKFGLINARKHESYEICFIPDNNYIRFLQDTVPDLRQKVSQGSIVLDGKIVGAHEGYPFYTIGQRKNIGAYGKKMYVTGIDKETNSITIGTDEQLHHRALIANKINWVGYPEFQGSMHVQAKVRYKDKASDAVVSSITSDAIKVCFTEPKRAITPGQSVVVYDGDDVVCGGVISEICNE